MLRSHPVPGTPSTFSTSARQQTRTFRPRWTTPLTKCFQRWSFKPVRFSPRRATIRGEPMAVTRINEAPGRTDPMYTGVRLVFGTPLTEATADASESAGNAPEQPVETPASEEQPEG